MNLQRALLRAMLWMLALAAAAGVVSIFASKAVMGRVAGTALVAAVAVALAIPVSKLLDDEKKRAAGLIGLLGVVISFIISLTAIWIDLFFSGWLPEERLAASAFVICVGSLLASGFLSQFHRPAARLASLAGAVADFAACAFFLSAIWYDFNSRRGETGGAIVASGAPIALCLIGATLTTRPWRWLGILAAAIAFALAIAGIWFIPSKDPSLYITLLSIAIVAAHANVVSTVPLGESGLWARLAAIGSMAATGACVSALSFITQGFDVTGPDILTRITGALAIVAACATTAIVILYRLNRRPPGAAERATDITAVQLVCPHCAKKSLIPVNGAACPSCGLLITITVREPNCTKCNYPLLDLKGSLCPECGTPRPSKASA